MSPLLVVTKSHSLQEIPRAELGSPGGVLDDLHFSDSREQTLAGSNVEPLSG